MAGTTGRKRNKNGCSRQPEAIVETAENPLKAASVGNSCNADEKTISSPLYAALAQDCCRYDLVRLWDAEARFYARRSQVRLDPSSTTDNLSSCVDP